MFFSVITVTLNSGKYLAETMASVLTQSCSDLEYLLIDGGSTDGTIEIIREHAGRDSRIRWLSEPDEGISDAFNKGLRLATGEIIGILNSDDTYAPGTLTAVAEAFSRHPEYDVVHGDMVRFQGDSSLFLLKPLPVERHIWHEMPVNHPATFVRASAYRRVGGFDPTFRVAMDYDLVLRLHTAGCRFFYLERVLANMRYGGASDNRFLLGLREVYRAVVREGYPRSRAGSWLLYKALLGWVKKVLRGTGLYGLMRLHPRFKVAPPQLPGDCNDRPADWNKGDHSE